MAWTNGALHSVWIRSETSTPLQVRSPVPLKVALHPEVGAEGKSTLHFSLKLTADSDARGDWFIPANDPTGEIQMDTSTDLQHWVEMDSFTYEMNEPAQFFRLINAH